MAIERKDKFTKAQRSYCMSQVKSKDTKIELIVRSALFNKGYRFRKHVKVFECTPDVVFTSKKVAVFIDGDFWHGRNFDDWRYKMNPFWENKILRNIARDKKNFRLLRRNGWKVIRIWEKKAYLNLESEIGRVERALR